MGHILSQLACPTMPHETQCGHTVFVQVSVWWQMKTLHTIHMQYYWPGLQTYIKDYCKSCTTCACAKPVGHKPYGLLKQLLVPKKPWNSISLDFIEKLLPSSSS